MIEFTIRIALPAYWLVRCCRHCPEVAARIWNCDHEPGYPEHKIDRPYLQGQLGLDLVDPAEIWDMVWFAEAPPEEQVALSLALNLRVDVNAGRVARSKTAPLALWKRQRARRIGAADYERQIAWLRWAEKNAPTHPDFQYRRPVQPAAVPIPQFRRNAR